MMQLELSMGRSMVGGMGPPSMLSQQKLKQRMAIQMTYTLKQELQLLGRVTAEVITESDFRGFDDGAEHFLHTITRCP